MQKAGFIGLGAMGEGMARNLAKGGFTVQGYDVDDAPMQRLAADGVQVCASAQEAAKGVDLLFVVVFRDTQADEILFGESDVLDGVEENATVIMNTTVSPDAARNYESVLAERGLGYIDAPVTGGKAGADEGTLTVIASGTDASMEKARVAFETMSSRIYNCGPGAGAASTIKMINQMMVGVHVAAMCEALAFATKAGADPKLVYDVITHGTGNSEIFRSRAPHIFDDDYAPRGVTEIFTKDLGTVSEVARGLGFPLPMTTLALQQFMTTASAGYERHDGIALAKLYENLTGVSISKAASQSTHVSSDD